MAETIRNKKSYLNYAILIMNERDKSEEPKVRIVVFTDISCYFSRNALTYEDLKATSPAPLRIYPVSYAEDHQIRSALEAVLTALCPRILHYSKLRLWTRLCK